MKKLSLFTLLFLLFAGIVSNAQERAMLIYKVNTVVVGYSVSEVDSIKFFEYSKTEDVGVEINGITWATRNVDAPGTFAATPESAGMLYQWNRKVGWSSTDPLEDSNGGTTWDTSIPDGTEWEKENDPCPSGWRVPTYDEQVSLLNSGNSWTTQNGVTGRVFGSGSNTLFLPAAGYRSYYDGTLCNSGTDGSYWSSTQGGSTYAYYLDFNGDNAVWDYYYRSGGYSVRCVQQERTMQIYKGNTVVAEYEVPKIDSVTFVEYSKTEEVGVEINGITWATRNVDAPGTFAATPESPGMFYQWNRKIGWSYTSPMVNSNGGTTWDYSTPSGTGWEPANDPCPSGWRVPTDDEQVSLLNSGYTWTSNGMVFGTAPNTIFLPAAGYRDDYDGSTLYDSGASGLYWSSTQDGSDDAYYLYFYSDDAYWDYCYRSYGFSVRCVAEE